MAIQEEIENINDIICNIKTLMEDYFYTQNYIDLHFAASDHTHPIDSELDINSLNPVVNKAITTELANKADNTLADSDHDGLMSNTAFRKLEAIEDEATNNVIDANITANSTNAVRSSAIYNALNTKADNVTANNDRNGLLTKEDYKKLSEIEPKATRTIIDTDLSDSSTNPVQNRAIHSALNTKADKNTYATINNAGLMTSDYVNIISNLQQSVAELQTEFDKNDLRILFLRYKNGVWEGAGGTQLVVDPGDYVYCQIDCTDPRYNKKDKTVRLFINGAIYNYTTDANGRTKTGKIIANTFPKGNYVISAFMAGVDNKNPVVDHKLLVVQ